MDVQETDTNDKGWLNGVKNDELPEERMDRGKFL